MKIRFAIIAIIVGLVLVNRFGADTIHQKGQVQANGIRIADVLNSLSLGYLHRAGTTTKL